MYLSYLQLVDIHTANTSLNMIQLDADYSKLLKKVVFLSPSLDLN